MISVLSRRTLSARLCTAISLAASVLLAACSPADQQAFTQQFQQQLLGGIGASGGALPGSMEHLFAQAPYNSAAPLSGQYPRVAFTVLSSPPNHGEFLLATAMRNASGCWQLSAVIWRSPSQSEPVAPFTACLQDVLRAPAAAQAGLRSYMNWWGPSSIMWQPSPGETTGTARTTGPLPPNTAFPQGVQAARYYGSVTPGGGPSQDSAEAWFWAAVLYHLDFDPAQFHDRRFWVVGYGGTS